MQMLIAIIKPYKVDDVKEVLLKNDVKGITIIQGEGFGRQRGHAELYRGAEYVMDLLPKVVVCSLIPDERVERIKKDVCDAARTGKVGDGIIWSLPFENYTRVRTGEVITDEEY